MFDNTGQISKRERLKTPHCTGPLQEEETGRRECEDLSLSTRQQPDAFTLLMHLIFTIKLWGRLLLLSLFSQMKRQRLEI